MKPKLAFTHCSFIVGNIIPPIYGTVSLPVDKYDVFTSSAERTTFCYMTLIGNVQAERNIRLPHVSFWIYLAILKTQQYCQHLEAMLNSE